MFDFTSEAPTAYASFLSPKAMRALSLLSPSPPSAAGASAGATGPPANNRTNVTDKALMRSRLLDPGQKYDVGVSIVVPETPANREAGMFQVYAELMTARGDVLAAATRPASLRYASAEVRWLRLLVHWPWYAFGLAEEKQTLSLPMFVGLHEKRDEPFTAIRVVIKSTHHHRLLPLNDDNWGGGGGQRYYKAVPPPQVYSAHANVNLVMGVLTRVMYSYPASSFVVMLVVTWGYMCMAAFMLFALVVVTGAVRTPSSFASEVVARAKEVMTANKGGGGGGGRRGGSFGFGGANLEPFFDGSGLTTTSGSDDDERSSSAPGSSRVSSEHSSYGGGVHNNDDGLRRRR